MAWDNLISRGIWVVIQPSNFLILLLLLSFLAYKFTNHVSRLKKASKNIIATCIVVLSVCGFTNISSWLLWPLEGRFDQYRNQLNNTPYSGIIVLAGSEKRTVSTYVEQVSLNAAGERLIEAAALARKLPDLPIIHSGGARAAEDQWSENDVARKFFQDAGLDLTRIRFDDKSYNTATNAAESAKLIKADETDPWLLVTSAFHMPRSVAAFRHAGVTIQPYPVDYMTSLKYEGIFAMNVSDNLKRLDWAIHEYVGLVAYYITGRSSSLFPESNQK